MHTCSPFPWTVAIQFLIFSPPLNNVQAGYRHIDCAQAYNNEKEVNDVLNVLLTSVTHHSSASKWYPNFETKVTGTRCCSALQVGFGLKKVLDEGIVKREDLFITSKLWSVSQKFRTCRLGTSDWTFHLCVQEHQPCAGGRPGCAGRHTQEPANWLRGSLPRKSAGTPNIRALFLSQFTKTQM